MWPSCTCACWSGAPSGNFTLGGHYLPWVELGPLLEGLTGRRLLKLPLHAGLMRLAGRLLDYFHDHISVQIPVSEESMEYATNWVQLDNSKVEKVLDFKLRPLEESMSDTVTWLYRAGTSRKSKPVYWPGNLRILVRTKMHIFSVGATPYD